MTNSEAPYHILPYSQQDFFYPNNPNKLTNNELYYPIKMKNFEQIYHPKFKYSDHASIGTPMVPYAATGTQQYVYNFTYNYVYITIYIYTQPRLPGSAWHYFAILPWAHASALARTRAVAPEGGAGVDYPHARTHTHTH